jgi:hypothetical protein
VKYRSREGERKDLWIGFCARIPIGDQRSHFGSTTEGILNDPVSKRSCEETLQGVREDLLYVIVGNRNIER